MQNKKNNGSVQPSAMESDQDFQDRVARKAYELFEDRGQAPGDDVEDWLAAERLVKRESSSPKARQQKRDRLATAESLDIGCTEGIGSRSGKGNRLAQGIPPENLWAFDPAGVNQVGGGGRALPRNENAVVHPKVEHVALHVELVRAVNTGGGLRVEDALEGHHPPPGAQDGTGPRPLRRHGRQPQRARAMRAGSSARPRGVSS